MFCLANAVFVKNVIELPTFKNPMISYQKLYISGCWETSLKSQEIWPYGARVLRWKPLLWAEKQPPLYTGLGTQGKDMCSPILQKPGVRGMGSGARPPGLASIWTLPSPLYAILDKLIFLCLNFLICKREATPRD